MIDNLLFNIATKAGVHVFQETRVMDVVYSKDSFSVFCNHGKECTARIVAGAYGKRSNLDIRWKRSFIRQRPGKLNHYIGVKYHVRGNFPSDKIFLHNFKDGYCGISAIEDNKYCLCYLTTAANLRNNRNDIEMMERNILRKNPHLDRIFGEVTHLFSEPLTISQVSFNSKTQVENHVLMLGDAAGLITPLCGNGMSMALHAGKIAFEEIFNFLQGKTTRFEMELQYTQRWEQKFSRRLTTGRMLQKMFGSELGIRAMISFLKPFPAISRYLIRQTHGEQF